jgi:hypothetical protein
MKGKDKTDKLQQNPQVVVWDRGMCGGGGGELWAAWALLLTAI